MEDRIQILIVEDEALIAHNLKMTLEDFGYDVIGVCFNYATALASIESLDFDLLILDINLGNHHSKTGLDIAQQLAKFKNVPFIFLTAFSDNDTIAKASLLKPSAYLTKPVNTANLFAAIQVAMINFSKNETNLGFDENLSPDFFFSKIGNKFLKVQWEDVIQLEAIKNYVKVRTKDEHKEYLIRGSLTQVQQNMIPEKFQEIFIRLNRSVLIAKSYILGFNDTKVITNYGEIESTKEQIKEIAAMLNQ